MNTNLPAMALDAAIKKVASDWESLMQHGRDVSAAKILFVNTGREIGLTLIGACGHEQMRFSFYENIKDRLPDTLTYSAVQKCIHLAHALPEPVKTIEEANRVETQLLLAGGFMELPHRDGAQRSHDVPPLHFFWRTFAETREKLLKKMDDISEWDERTKSSVKEEVQSFRKALVEIEAKL